MIELIFEIQILLSDLVSFADHVIYIPQPLKGIEPRAFCASYMSTLQLSNTSSRLLVGVLRIEPRALCVLEKHCISSPSPDLKIWVKVSLSCSDWPPTCKPPTLASQVAEITNMYYTVHGRFLKSRGVKGELLNWRCRIVWTEKVTWNCGLCCYSHCDFQFHS